MDSNQMHQPTNERGLDDSICHNLYGQQESTGRDYDDNDGYRQPLFTKHGEQLTSASTDDVSGVRDTHAKYSNIFKRHQIHQFLKRNGSTRRSKGRIRNRIGDRNLSFLPKYHYTESSSSNFGVQKHYNYNVFKHIDCFNQPLPFLAKDIEQTLKNRRAFLVNMSQTIESFDNGNDKSCRNEKDYDKDDEKITDEYKNEKEKENVNESSSYKIHVDNKHPGELLKGDTGKFSSVSGRDIDSIRHNLDVFKRTQTPLGHHNIQKALDFKSPDALSDLYKVRVVNFETKNRQKRDIVKAIPQHNDNTDKSKVISHSHYATKTASYFKPMASDPDGNLFNMDADYQINQVLNSPQNGGKYLKPMLSELEADTLMSDGNNYQRNYFTDASHIIRRSINDDKPNVMSVEALNELSELYNEIAQRRSYSVSSAITTEHAHPLSHPLQNNPNKFHSILSNELESNSGAFHSEKDTHFTASTSGLLPNKNSAPPTVATAATATFTHTTTSSSVYPPAHKLENLKNQTVNIPANQRDVHDRDYAISPGGCLSLKKENYNSNNNNSIEMVVQVDPTSNSTRHQMCYELHNRRVGRHEGVSGVCQQQQQQHQQKHQQQQNQQLQYNPMSHGIHTTTTTTTTTTTSTSTTTTTISNDTNSSTNTPNTNVLTEILTTHANRLPYMSSPNSPPTSTSTRFNNSQIADLISPPTIITSSITITSTTLNNIIHNKNSLLNQTTGSISSSLSSPSPPSQHPPPPPYILNPLPPPPPYILKPPPLLPTTTRSSPPDYIPKHPLSPPLSSCSKISLNPHNSQKMENTIITKGLNDDEHDNCNSTDDNDDNHNNKDDYHDYCNYDVDNDEFIDDDDDKHESHNDVEKTHPANEHRQPIKRIKFGPNQDGIAPHHLSYPDIKEEEETSYPLHHHPQYHHHQLHPTVHHYHPTPPFPELPLHISPSPQLSEIIETELSQPCLTNHQVRRLYKYHHPPPPHHLLLRRHIEQTNRDTGSDTTTTTPNTTNNYYSSGKHTEALCEEDEPTAQSHNQTEPNPNSDRVNNPWDRDTSHLFHRQPQHQHQHQIQLVKNNTNTPVIGLGLARRRRLLNNNNTPKKLYSNKNFNDIPSSDYDEVATIHEPESDQNRVPNYMISISKEDGNNINKKTDDSTPILISDSVLLLNNSYLDYNDGYSYNSYTPTTHYEEPDHGMHIPFSSTNRFQGSIVSYSYDVGLGGLLGHNRTQRDSFTSTNAFDRSETARSEGNDVINGFQTARNTREEATVTLIDTQPLPPEFGVLEYKLPLQQQQQYRYQQRQQPPHHRQQQQQHQNQNEGRVVLVAREMNDIMNKFMKNTDPTSTSDPNNGSLPMSTFGKINGSHITSQGVSSQSAAKELQRLKYRPHTTMSAQQLRDGLGGGRGVGPMKVSHSIEDSTVQFDSEIDEINRNAVASIPPPSKVLNTQQQRRRPPPPPPPPLPQHVLSSFSSPPTSSSSTAAVKRPMSAAAVVPTSGSLFSDEDDTAPLPTSTPTGPTTNNNNNNNNLEYNDGINEPIRPRSASRRRAYIIKRPQSAPLFGKITPITSTSQSEITNTKTDNSPPSSGLSPPPIPQITPHFSKETPISQQQMTQSITTHNKNRHNCNAGATTNHQQDSPTNDPPTSPIPTTQSHITPNYRTGAVLVDHEISLSSAPASATSSFTHNDTNSHSNVTKNHHTSQQNQTPTLPILEEEYSIDRKERVTVRHVETIVIPSPRLKSDTSITLNSSISPEEGDIKSIQKPSTDIIEKEESSNCTNSVKQSPSEPLCNSFKISAPIIISDSEMYTPARREVNSPLGIEDMEVSDINTNTTHLKPGPKITTHQNNILTVYSSRISTPSKSDTEEAEFISSVTLSSTARGSPRSYKNEVLFNTEMIDDKMIACVNSDSDFIQDAEGVSVMSDGVSVSNFRVGVNNMVRTDPALREAVLGGGYSGADGGNICGVPDTHTIIEDGDGVNIDDNHFKQDPEEIGDRYCDHRKNEGSNLMFYNSEYALAKSVDDWNIGGDRVGVGGCELNNGKSSDAELHKDVGDDDVFALRYAVTKHTPVGDKADGGCAWDPSGSREGYGNVTGEARNEGNEDIDAFAVSDHHPSVYQAPSQQIENDVHADHNAFSQIISQSAITSYSDGKTINEIGVDVGNFPDEKQKVNPDVFVDDNADDDDIMMGLDDIDEVGPASIVTSTSSMTSSNTKGDVSSGPQNGHLEKGPQGDVFIPDLRLASVVATDSFSDSEDIERVNKQGAELCDTSSDEDYGNYNDVGDLVDGSADLYDDPFFEGDDKNRLSSDISPLPFKDMSGFGDINSGLGVDMDDNDARLSNTNAMVDNFYNPVLLGKIDEEERSIASEWDHVESKLAASDMSGFKQKNDKSVEDSVFSSDSHTEVEELLVVGNLRELHNAPPDESVLPEEIDDVSFRDKRPGTDGRVTGGDGVNKRLTSPPTVPTGSSPPTVVLDHTKRYSSPTDDSDTASNRAGGGLFSRKLNKNGLLDPLPGLSEPLAADIDTDDEPVVTMKKKSPFKRFFARKKGKYNPSTDFDTCNSVLPTFEEKKDSAKKTKSYSPTLSRKKKNKVALESVKSVNIVEETPKSTKKGKKIKEKDKEKVVKPGKIDKSNIVVIKSTGTSLSQPTVDIIPDPNADAVPEPPHLSPVPNFAGQELNPVGQNLNSDLNRIADSDEFHEHKPIEYANVDEELADDDTQFGEDNFPTSMLSKNNAQALEYSGNDAFDRMGRMSSPEIVDMMRGDMDSNEVYVNTSEALSSCTSSFVSPTSPEAFSSSSFDRQVSYCDSSSDIVPSIPTDSDLGADSENPQEHNLTFQHNPFNESERLKVNPLFSSPEPESGFHKKSQAEKGVKLKHLHVDSMLGASGSDFDEENLKTATFMSASEIESDTLPASESDFDEAILKDNVGGMQFSSGESTCSAGSFKGEKAEGRIKVGLNRQDSRPRVLPNLSRKLSSIETTESDTETDEALLAAASEFPLNRPKYGKVPILDENGSIVKRHSETHLTRLDDADPCSPFESGVENDSDFMNEIMRKAATVKKQKSIKRDRIECGDVSLEAESDQVDFAAAAVLGISMDSFQDELDTTLVEEDAMVHDGHGDLNTDDVDIDGGVVLAQTVPDELGGEVKSSTTLHRSPSQVLVAAQVHRTVLDDSISSLSDSNADVVDADYQEEKNNGTKMKKTDVDNDNVVGDNGDSGRASMRDDDKVVGGVEYLSSMAFTTKYLSGVSGVLEKDDSVDLEKLDPPSGVKGYGKDHPSSSRDRKGVKPDYENNGATSEDHSRWSLHESAKSCRKNIATGTSGNDKEVTDSMLELVGLINQSDKNNTIDDNDKVPTCAEISDSTDEKNVVENANSRMNNSNQNFQYNEVFDEPQRPKVTLRLSLKLKAKPELVVSSKENSKSFRDPLNALSSSEEEVPIKDETATLSKCSQLANDVDGKRRDDDLGSKELPDLAVEYSIVPFISDRNLLRRNHCRNSLANLDKRVGNAEVECEKDLIRSNVTSPECSNNGQRNSEIENKDLITGALRDLDDFVKSDLEDGDEGDLDAAKSIADIVKETRLSLGDDDVTGIDFSEYEGREEVVEDVIEKQEKVTDNHALPRFFSSTTETHVDDLDGDVEVGLDGVEDASSNEDGNAALLDCNDEISTNVTGSLVKPAMENTELISGLDIDISAIDSDESNAESNVFGNRNHFVTVDSNHEDRGTDDNNLANVQENPQIPACKNLQPLSIHCNSQSTPDLPQTSQTVLEEEYEEVVDKLDKPMKDPGNKLSYDEVSDTATDTDKEQKPSPRRFVFPWKKKEKDNVEKTNSNESGKSEKTKSKGKDGKSGTNKDTKTKSDSKDSKQKPDSKQKFKTKGDNDKGGPRKYDKENNKKLKKSKSHSNLPNEDDDMYHEIEDNKVNTCKTECDVIPNTTQTAPDVDDSSLSDYEPVNYIKDQEKDKIESEPELRQKQLTKKLLNQRHADSCGYEIPAEHQAKLAKAKDKRKKKEKKKKDKKKKGEKSPRKSDDTESQSSQLEADDENVDSVVPKRNKTWADDHDDDGDIITPYLTFAYPRFIDDDIYVDSPLPSSPDFEHFKKEKKARSSSCNGDTSSVASKPARQKSKIYSVDVPLSAVESREDRKEKELSGSPPFSFSPSLMRKDEVSLTEAFAKAFPSLSGDFSLSQMDNDNDDKDGTTRSEINAEDPVTSQNRLVIQQPENVPDKTKWRMGLSHGIGSVSPEVSMSSTPPLLNSVPGDHHDKNTPENEANKNDKKDEKALTSKNDSNSNEGVSKNSNDLVVNAPSKKNEEKKNKKDKKSKGGFFKRFERKKESATASSPSSTRKNKEKKTRDKEKDESITDTVKIENMLSAETPNSGAASDKNDELDTGRAHTATVDPSDEEVFPTYENGEEIPGMDIHDHLSAKMSIATDIQEIPDSPSMYARVKKSSLSKSISLEGINKTNDYSSCQPQHQQKYLQQQRFEKTVSLFDPPDDDDDRMDVLDSAASRNIELSKDHELFSSEYDQNENSMAPNLKSLFSDHNDIKIKDKEVEKYEEVEYDTAFPRSRLDSLPQTRDAQTKSQDVMAQPEDTMPNNQRPDSYNREDNFSPDSAACVFFIGPEQSQSFVSEEHWKDYSPLEMGRMTTNITHSETQDKIGEQVNHQDHTDNADESNNKTKPKLTNRTLSMPPAIPVPKARRNLPTRANSELTTESPRHVSTNNDDENGLVQFDDIWKAAGDGASPRLPDSEDSRQILQPADEDVEKLIMPKMRKYNPGTDILGISNHINLPAKQKPQKPERRGSQRESMYIVKDGQNDVDSKLNNDAANVKTTDNNDDGNTHNDNSDDNQSIQDTGSVTDEYDHLPIRMRQTTTPRPSFPPFQPIVPPTNYASSSSSNSSYPSRHAHYQPTSTPTSPIEYSGVQKSLRMHRESSTVYSSPWKADDIAEQLTPKLPPRQYRRSESEDPLTASASASRLSLTSVDLGRSESVSEVATPGGTLRKSVSLSFGLNNDGGSGGMEKRKKGGGGDDKEEKGKKAISLRTLTSLFRRKKSKKDKESDNAPNQQNENWQLQRPLEDTHTKKDHTKEKSSTKDKSSKFGKRSSKSKAAESGDTSSASSSFRTSDPAHWARPVCRLVRVNEDGTREVELSRQGGGRLGVLFAKGSEDGVEDGLFINSFHDRNTSKLFSGILCIGDEVLDIDGQDVHYMTLEEVKAVIGLKVTMTLRIMPSTIARSIL